MAVQYERYENDIEAAEDELSIPSDEDVAADSASGSQLQWAPGVFPQTATPLNTRMNRYSNAFQGKWPFKMGVCQLVVGGILFVLGLLQVFILPLAINPLDGPINRLEFSHHNCYGISLWVGFLLSITGCLGVRAALQKNPTTVYIYFLNVMLNLALEVCLIVMILIAYSEGWFKLKDFPEDAALFYIMVVVTVLIPVGFVLLVLTFTQYYEDVFCGEMQICRRAMHCFCPCFCPRVVEPEELLEEDNRTRLPSLPI